MSAEDIARLIEQFNANASPEDLRTLNDIVEGRFKFRRGIGAEKFALAMSGRAAPQLAAFLQQQRELPMRERMAAIDAEIKGYMQAKQKLQDLATQIELAKAQGRVQEAVKLNDQFLKLVSDFYSTDQQRKAENAKLVNNRRLEVYKQKAATARMMKEKYVDATTGLQMEGVEPPDADQIAKGVDAVFAWYEKRPGPMLPQPGQPDDEEMRKNRAEFAVNFTKAVNAKSHAEAQRVLGAVQAHVTGTPLETKLNEEAPEGQVVAFDNLAASISEYMPGQPLEVDATRFAGLVTANQEHLAQLVGDIETDRFLLEELRADPNADPADIQQMEELIATQEAEAGRITATLESLQDTETAQQTLARETGKSEEEEVLALARLGGYVGDAETQDAIAKARQVSRSAMTAEQLQDTLDTAYAEPLEAMTADMTSLDESISALKQERELAALPDHLRALYDWAQTDPEGAAIYGLVRDANMDENAVWRLLRQTSRKGGRISLQDVKRALAAGPATTELPEVAEAPEAPRAPERGAIPSKEFAAQIPKGAPRQPEDDGPSVQVPAGVRDQGEAPPSPMDDQKGAPTLPTVPKIKGADAQRPKDRLDVAEQYVQQTDASGRNPYEAAKMKGILEILDEKRGKKGMPGGVSPRGRSDGR